MIGWLALVARLLRLDWLSAVLLRPTPPLSVWEVSS